MTRINLKMLTAGTLLVALLTSAYALAQREEKPARPRLVTLHGTVVDLYSYMTGLGAGASKNPADQVKLMRDSIKNGVPACIETDEGVVLLGKGTKAPIELVMPLVSQEVEVRGKLYEKEHLQFIDIVAIKPLAKEGAKEHAEEEGAGEDEGEGEDEEP